MRPTRRLAGRRDGRRLDRQAWTGPRVDSAARQPRGFRRSHSRAASSTYWSSMIRIGGTSKPSRLAKVNACAIPLPLGPDRGHSPAAITRPADSSRPLDRRNNRHQTIPWRFSPSFQPVSISGFLLPYDRADFAPFLDFSPLRLAQLQVRRTKPRFLEAHTVSDGLSSFFGECRAGCEKRELEALRRPAHGVMACCRDFASVATENSRPELLRIPHHIACVVFHIVGSPFIRGPCS